MKTVVIEGQHRKDLGKKATRDLRSQGLVPGIIYGGEKTVSFSAPNLSFRDIVYTPNFMLAEIKLDGASHTCILKDLQFDPVTDQLIHIDFQELVEDRKIIAEIPLHFEGRAKGVLDGGVFNAKMKTLRVRTYPKYLLENIVVDISNLKLMDNLRVEDVKLENIEIMNSPRQPIAGVGLTRTLRQTGATAAGDTEGEEEAEGEGEEAKEGEENAAE